MKAHSKALDDMGLDDPFSRFPMDSIASPERDFLYITELDTERNVEVPGIRQVNNEG